MVPQKVTLRKRRIGVTKVYQALPQQRWTDHNPDVPPMLLLPHDAHGGRGERVGLREKDLPQDPHRERQRKGRTYSSGWF